MRLVRNPVFPKGFNYETSVYGKRTVSTDNRLPLKLMTLCPNTDKVRLKSLEKLSSKLGLGNLTVIDESQRMGLGSFKALGATYAMIKIALGNCFELDQSLVLEEIKEKLSGKTFSTASAGNHGLSVAAGARVFGANSQIYVSKNVPTAFIRKLEGFGAKVKVHGATYDESLNKVILDSEKSGWILLSDSTWDGYDLGLDVMEGYLISISQALKEISIPPTHVFLQAGVGGLAASFAAYIRKVLGDEPIIYVVEPSNAPCLQRSIEYGRLMKANGPTSKMGRLDCKIPSLKAFYSLSKTANSFITITERESELGTRYLASQGYSISQSGSAGLVALSLLCQKKQSEMNYSSRVLCIFSEGDIK